MPIDFNVSSRGGFESLLQTALTATPLVRLWSQIQRRFYGHDDLSVRDETL
jgi:hypothetical protein